jgi:apolipoprotein N-acyltransferase
MKPAGATLDSLLALVTGILLALSFPRFGQPAFAWVALVPLLVALAARPQRVGRFRPLRAFGLGWIAGVAYFAGTVYWTGAVVRTYGGLSLPVAVFAAAALVAYLALFPALFALVIGWLIGRVGAVALLLAPAVWVTAELGRAHFWSGFPWVLLGYSQIRVLPVAQFASLFGVYGVSALVALSSAALAYVLVTRSRQAAIAAAAAGAAIVLVAVWGHGRLRDGSLARAGTPMRVAIVQGNVPQDQKWNPARAGIILERYLTMTRSAALDGAHLVVWPESSTPFYFEEDRAGAERVRAVVRASGVDLLFGSDQIERGDPPAYYNSAFMLRPDGSTAAVYRKMYLVPFGEYVPLKRLLFFVGPVVEAMADFSPGREVVMLPVDGAPISTAICYEIVYPGLVRRAVLAGSRLLTTITNDAWYGQSSAPYQHFEQAAMRAIEQGRYLVRSANTGISGMVDPYGRVIRQSALFETVVLVGDVRLLDGLTVYGRIGDLLAYLCAAMTAGAAIAGWRRAA